MTTNDRPNRYLYAYPANIFNGDTPAYDVEPLKSSDVLSMVIFAGKPIGQFASMMDNAICYIYLESKAPLNEKNVYRNLRIYENLLCLNTGKPAEPGSNVDITNYPDVTSIIKEFGAEEKSYNKPDIQHHGMVREYNTVQLLPASTNFMNKMKDDEREKAERALQTFIIAEEIGYTVNPHTKATVRATLYLSAINQLAEKTEDCTHRIDKCPECSKPVVHQKVGHAKRVEELMRKLLTGKNLEHGVKLIKSGYYSVRSPYLHEGTLSGGENEGGWIADDPENLQFEENLVNYMNTCRKLIQLYIQAGAQ